jgi:hypothetical protein
MLPARVTRLLQVFDELMVQSEPLSVELVSRQQAETRHPEAQQRAGTGAP